jgi:hypothetical protein
MSGLLDAISDLRRPSITNGDAWELGCDEQHG